MEIHNFSHNGERSEKMDLEVESAPIGRKLSSCSQGINLMDCRSLLSAIDGISEAGRSNGGRRRSVTSTLSTKRDSYASTLASKFHVPRPQDIVWAHAVNSASKLQRALEAPVHMLEVDVSFGSYRPMKKAHRKNQGQGAGPQYSHDINENNITIGAPAPPLLASACTSSSSTSSGASADITPGSPPATSSPLPSPSTSSKKSEEAGKRVKTVVLSHPPFKTSDLTLHQFLKAVCEHNDAVRASLLEDPLGEGEEDAHGRPTISKCDDEDSFSRRESQEFLLGDKDITNGHNNNNAKPTHRPQLKGIKLDFKDDAVVRYAIFMLQQLNVCERVPAVWLNADVCFGPGIPWLRSPVGVLQGEAFLHQCARIPEAAISLGWVCTEYSFLASYTSHMLQDMLSLLKKAPELKNQHITFAVCATYVCRSLLGLQKLLEECASITQGTTSLTVWTGYGSWGITKEDEELIISKARELSLSTFIDVRTRPARRLCGNMCTIM